MVEMFHFSKSKNKLIIQIEPKRLICEIIFVFRHLLDMFGVSVCFLSGPVISELIDDVL